MGSLRILFSVCLAKQTHANLIVFVSVLEEFDPVILVLVLMLVSVGRLPLELVVVKIDFTSFLIIYSSFKKTSIFLSEQHREIIM